ncbi:PH domain-containing protein [Micromonospora sp. C28SCA-DRY-2]|uniref:PH domain-containing protein n=1 Tax=Micromonospora sp. C28SCA-DRY-2 TaxID=3059522 RepID=UPI0026756B60|nr:PH domain-containing protein [Micromonospora sp. C28SCA-DRY-2]MDO3705739.1 PH domain-containing protein [Micromonospora sp. C28SCA-DRY-2]
MTGWRRLDVRMVWVDVVRSLLSLAPTGLAVGVFRVEARLSTLWPVLAVAVVGVAQAGHDLLRWAKTRYRVTGERVELRTGLLVRSHRSVRRDRIRSVTATATLRHRLAGLRVVTVGAGLPGAEGEAALRLDAVNVRTAERLRRDLLGGEPVAPPGDGAAPGDEPAERDGSPRSGSPVRDAAARGGPRDADARAGLRDADDPATDGATPSGAGARPAGAARGGGAVAGDARVLARIRWSWLVHNVVNVWAFVMAAGLLWGAYWTAGSFGFDAAGAVAELLDWRALGLGWSAVIAVAAAGVLGVAGMAVAFVAEFWDFRLTRVRTAAGSVLRTSQGLFKTREVDRDDDRLRGVEISEPVLWRWMGTADTNVITTGLTVWSMTPATIVLPRGPVRVARSVAAAVLDADPNPFEAPLRGHPPAALRRRLGWAALVVAALTGALAGLGAVLGLPRLWLAGPVSAPLVAVAAVVAYRALGHATVGDHLVVRSGLVSRSTSALRGGAVIGWQVRQSVLQRRLGLATLTATTAAGHGRYAAVDLAAADVVALAERTLPGLLAPFATAPPDQDPSLPPAHLARPAA